MKKTLLAFACAALLSFPAAFADGTPKHSFTPPGGFVPDAKTAVRIAVAVWSPIYGDQHIQSEKPFRATLKKGVWTVEGSLPKNMAGGVAIAEISKTDGRILRVSHGR